MLDVHEAKSVIDAILMDKAINYLQTAEQWTLDEAVDGCEQYKNYLFLLVTHPHEILPPSYQIQKTWKAHILSSFDDYIDLKKKLLDEDKNVLEFKNYFEDKKFINHSVQAAYQRLTTKYYQEEFGDALPNFSSVNLRRKNKWALKDFIKPILFYSLFIIFLIGIPTIIILIFLNRGA